MTKKSISIGVIAVTLQVLMLSASPAFAITAELAKKCRDLAIIAHPTQPAGTTAYAAAQRDFFDQCIAKNGDMDSGGSSSSSNSPPGKSN
jgi:hypothetical protein